MSDPVKQAPVVKTIEVPCSQKQAYRVFVDSVGSWWPLDKNSVSAMQGEVAREVTIEAKQGGAVYEIGHDGTRHEWGSVSIYKPSDKLVLNWHIGLSPEKATTVTVDFTAVDSITTKVVLTHDNWEAFAEKASDMREGYNQGWVGVFETAYAGAVTANT